jgi:thymidylate kinase
MTDRPTRVVVIGPCVAGKSTVVAALRERGVDARSVAQEHTVIPDLWRNQGPDLLVYLDVSYREAARRREIAWGPERHEEQKRFMSAARQAAALVISTDGLTVHAVVDLILERLSESEAAQR